MFSPRLLDHFEHPRNAGEVPHPDADVQLENPACGDILRLSAKIRDGRIADIRFRSRGCVAAMACASAVTELAKGRTPGEAQAITSEDVAEAVGGVPQASTHAPRLAVEALGALLKKLG